MRFWPGDCGMEGIPVQMTQGESIVAGHQDRYNSFNLAYGY